jgi:hypothetical protein
MSDVGVRIEWCVHKALPALLYPVESFDRGSSLLEIIIYTTQIRSTSSRL